MKNILIAVIIVLVLGGGAFFYFSRYGNNMNTPSSNNSNSTGEVPAANNISIKNFTFMPSTLNVPVGITVTWTNNDSTPHSIKSATFNSSTLNTGDKFSFTFKTPGSYKYNCGIHPTMTGTIMVVGLLNQ